jgi:hypothetical protein
LPEAPLFRDTLHIGFVVRDLDASMRVFFQDYGVGPWAIYDLNPGVVKEMAKDDEPAAFSLRIGVATVGRLQWELIQPLDDRSHYAEALSARGEGFHHLGLAVSEYAEATGKLRAMGHKALMSGDYKGNLFAHFSTESDLAFIAELLHWGSGEPPEHDRFYPSGDT